MNMSEEESSFYVAIEDPKLFRRELLGSSKMMIGLLQRYEAIKKIREEKIKSMFKFNEVAQEIVILINRLNKTIPQTKLRNLYEKSQGIVEKRKDNKQQVKEEKLVHPEITQLQKELFAIEEKLSKLK